MRYFSENEHSIVTDVIIVNNFYFIPKVFYVEPYMRRIKATIEEAINYANSGYVVALIHTRNYVLRTDVRRDFEKLISKTNKILTLKEYIECRLKGSKTFRLS